MKHLQSGRCSITVMGLQDISEILIHLLQSYFYSKMSRTDRGRTHGSEKD